MAENCSLAASNDKEVTEDVKARDSGDNNHWRYSCLMRAMEHCEDLPCNSLVLFWTLINRRLAKHLFPRKWTEMWVLLHLVTLTTHGTNEILDKIKEFYSSFTLHGRPPSVFQTAVRNSDTRRVQKVNVTSAKNVTYKIFAKVLLNVVSPR